MSAAPPVREGAAISTPDAAVIKTLEQADDAAASGDYRSALSWLGVVDAIGDELPSAYKAKRQAWLAAVGAGGLAMSARHGRR